MFLLMIETAGQLNEEEYAYRYLRKHNIGGANGRG